MTSPWLALPAGTDAADRLRRVARARESFLATGRAGRAMRPMVAESWARSLAAGLDLTVAGPPVELVDDELDDYRAAHPLASVLPVIRRLLVEDAADAGLIVAVSDADGRLLWVEGATGLVHKAESMHFVEGARWSEDVAGTNAPGTALALDHAVQIYAAEHLADAVTPWSCSAAPVHAADGRLIGAIDLTGGADVASPATLTMVRAAAAAVETELRLQALTAPPVRPQLPTPRRGLRSRLARPALPTLGVLASTGELTTPAGTTSLRMRHAEILVLLREHRGGLTTEQLAILLHDDTAARVTLRAEMSRLRDLLAETGGPALASRPYRLDGPLTLDLDEVRSQLDRGNLRRALAAYPGPLLPRSEAPGVVELRRALSADVRACVLAAGNGELAWELAQRPEHAADTELLERCLALLPRGSRLRPLVAERLRRVDDDLR